ncbi:MAG TPA: hypothetical protein VFT99_12160 [Roseiflexaceae bacterium]|nr:hypothetical protein [Roseiflexaceae bacterium]
MIVRHIAAVVTLSLALLATPAQAAPKPLPACTPAQVATWPITDRNTIVEGRTILIHTSPDGTRRCGEVQVSTQRPQAPRKVKR